MNTDRIIEQIATDPLCEVRKRPSRLTLAGADWPADWRTLSETYDQFNLFTHRHGAEASGNSWQLWLTETPLMLNEFTHAVSPPELDPFFSRCLVIGLYARDSSDVIGLNLNPGPGFGKVFFTWRAMALGYRCPIIADSVTEWLELTYRAGYASGYYFLRDDFPDRGPVVPGDPEYTGVTCIFDP